MGASISSFENEIRYVINVKGLKSDSSSPTDTWIVDYQKPGEPIQKLFYKMFLVSEKLDKIDLITGLKYEINVYNDIIKPLITNNVCPFFVKYVTHYENIPYEQLSQLTNNDDVALTINKMSMYCKTVEEAQDKKIFLTDYINMMRGVCIESAVVNKRDPSQEKNYTTWMTLHRFPFILKFDCIQLDVRYPSLKRPLFDQYFRKTSELITQLEKVSSLEYKRFERATLELKTKSFDYKSAIRKIIRRRIDVNYVMDDVFVTPKEKLKLNDLTTISVVSKDDFLLYTGMERLELPTFLQEPEWTKRKTQVDAFYVKQSEVLDHINYNILITEAVDNTTIKFSDYMSKIKDYALVENEFLTIFLQICIACYSMSLSKMNHNDIHSSNIFVSTLPAPELFTFVINGTEYTFTTRHKVLIYDFDKSYVTRLGNNPILDGICEYGQCNKFNEMLDIFKISCYLTQHRHNSDYVFVPKIFPLLVSNNTEKKNKLIAAYSSYHGCLFSQERIEEVLSLLVPYPQIIANVFAKIKSEPILGLKRNVYCIDARFFDNKGKLDIVNQQTSLNDIHYRMSPPPLPATPLLPLLPLPLPFHHKSTSHFPEETFTPPKYECKEIFNDFNDQMELECAEDIEDFTPSPGQVSDDMEIEEEYYDLDGKRFNSRRKKVKSKSPLRKKKSTRKSHPRVRKSTRKQRKSSSQRKQATRKSRK